MAALTRLGCFIVCPHVYGDCDLIVSMRWFSPELREAFLVRAGGEQLHHALNTGFESERRLSQLELASLDLGEVEDLVDERQKRTRRLVDGTRIRLLLGRLLSLRLRRWPGLRRGRALLRATLGEDVKPETIARWISLTPEPPNFKPEITGSQVEFAGDFG